MPDRLFVHHGTEDHEIPVFGFGVVRILGPPRVRERLTDLHIDMLVIEDTVRLRREPAHQKSQHRQTETGDEMLAAKRARQRSGEPGEASQANGHAEVHAPHRRDGRNGPLLVH